MILPGPGSRAQSNVLGAALMLGLIVTAVGIAGMVGAAALNDTQQQVGVERSINTMTLFDSRAALVALGDADTQSVSFASGGGDYEVRPDAGWLRITHFNYSEEERTETIYNASLGALVHTAGDTEIALPGFAAGQYAFAAYEDRNGNEELDTGLFGAPTEPYAFSRNARPMFGVPQFADCAMTLAPGDSVTLKLR